VLAPGGPPVGGEIPYFLLAILTAASAVIRALLISSHKGPDFNWASSFLAFRALIPVPDSESSSSLFFQFHKLELFY